MRRSRSYRSFNCPACKATLRMSYRCSTISEVVGKPAKQEEPKVSFFQKVSNYISDFIQGVIIGLGWLFVILALLLSIYEYMFSGVSKFF